MEGRSDSPDQKKDSRPAPSGEHDHMYYATTCPTQRHRGWAWGYPSRARPSVAQRHGKQPGRVPVFGGGGDEGLWAPVQHHRLETTPQQIEMGCSLMHKFGMRQNDSSKPRPSPYFPLQPAHKHVLLQSGPQTCGQQNDRSHGSLGWKEKRFARGRRSLEPLSRTPSLLSGLR